MTANFGQMLDELNLIANEREEHIRIIEKLGKTDHGTLGVKRVRVRVLREAIAAFERCKSVIEGSPATQQQNLL
jgi:predicted Ser/Thr protein kinase